MEKIFTEDFKKRFWSKVDKTESCWEWTGAKSTDGYGYMWILRQKLSIKTHRLSYIYEYGLVEKELCVCHRCDNPKCVRPDHLWQGTTAENNFDRIAKGRTASHVGEKNPSAKLKKEDIMEIKELRKTGLSQQKIANIFHVSQVRISMILLGKTWKHLSSLEI